MMCFDDGGLVEEILEICTRQEFVSDRYHGRKFYPWLRGASFTDIKMFYQVDDTTTMDPDEREDFFDYYFSFRPRYVRRALETDPNNPVCKADLERLEDDLDRLREQFIKPEFFFSTMTVSCVAIK